MKLSLRAQVYCPPEAARKKCRRFRWSGCAFYLFILRIQNDAVVSWCQQVGLFKSARFGNGDHLTVHRKRSDPVRTAFDEHIWVVHLAHLRGDGDLRAEE